MRSAVAWLGALRICMSWEGRSTVFRRVVQLFSGNVCWLSRCSAVGELVSEQRLKGCVLFGLG